MPVGKGVTVGVVIPIVSPRLVSIRDVKEVKDVLNRVAGMTRLEYGKMTPRCGGKLCPEWYCLAEGDVVCIDYPYEYLPDSLKELAAKEAAGDPAKLYVPRPKSALPIRAPADGFGQHQQTLGILGFPEPLIQLPAPVLPLPFQKGPIIDHLTGDPAPDFPLPAVPSGIQLWENNFQNFQGPGKFDAGPTRPRPTAIDSKYQPKWSALAIDKHPPRPGPPMGGLTSLFGPSYRKVKVNPVIRVNFEFWTGQEASLQLHPDNRISTVVHNLLSMLKDGKIDADPKRLIFIGPDPNQKIGLDDKMSSLFPHQPAEVNLKVFLADFSGEIVEMADVAMKDTDLLDPAERFWGLNASREPPFVFPKPK
ncbi:hypothetical protein TWF281_004098 [Arthrobotrys megalospora]